MLLTVEPELGYASGGRGIERMKCDLAIYIAYDCRLTIRNDNHPMPGGFIFFSSTGFMKRRKEWTFENKT
ncbi:hypothetical protein [Brevibacillus sp. SYSU BS000544]|uniref:hypothetical protein n=1 Tax=Brevibacillus sp. SYSU BS000544 TaxID=3416443 RepID=UPI003CE46283